MLLNKKNIASFFCFTALASCGSGEKNYDHCYLQLLPNSTVVGQTQGKTSNSNSQIVFTASLDSVCSKTVSGTGSVDLELTATLSDVQNTVLDQINLDGGRAILFSSSSRVSTLLPEYSVVDSRLSYYGRLDSTFSTSFISWELPWKDAKQFSVKFSKVGSFEGQEPYSVFLKIKQIK